MNKKMLVSAAVLAALAAPVGAVEAASILRTVGQHPVSAPLATIEALQSMMRTMGGDIQAGMAAAGHAELFPLVQAHIAQYPQAQIAIVDYLPGQRIDWMLFRHNGRGRVKVARDVTWGGTAPLQVFEFAVDKNGQRYTFAVPLQCGNLALKDYGPAPAPMQIVQQQAPLVKEVIREVPVPGPTVYVDRPVVQQVQVPVPGPTVYVPQEVVKYVDRPVVQQVQVPVPGPTVYVPKEVIKYVDRPVVKEVAVPGPTRTVVERVVVQAPARTVYVDKPVVKEVQTGAKCCESPFHFLADAGYLRQPEEADYGIGRLGVEYVLNPEFSFLALAGGAAKAGGDAGADAFVLDFLVQYNLFQCSTQGGTWSPLFMGLGIGAWMTNGEDTIPSEDSQADFIAELGLRIFGNPFTTSAALFMEGRVATDEWDDMDKYGRLGGGLRFRF
jgi:hypothetical protein